MKKRRIHKREHTYASGAAAIACMTYTIDAHFTSWAWKDVTCLPCLRKQPARSS